MVIRLQSPEAFDVVFSVPFALWCRKAIFVHKYLMEFSLCQGFWGAAKCSYEQFNYARREDEPLLAFDTLLASRLSHLFAFLKMNSRHKSPSFPI